MTAVASGSPDRGGVLPRHWDGHRLLRFLTGLAMIALAFTVRVTPLALPGAHAAAQPVTRSVSVSVIQPDAVQSDAVQPDHQPITQSSGPLVALPARASVALPAGQPITQSGGQTVAPAARVSLALPADQFSTRPASGSAARSLSPPLGGPVARPDAQAVTPSAAQLVAAGAQARSRATTVVSSAFPPLPAAVPAETGPLALGSAVFLLLVAGYALRVRAQRAPPLA